MVIIEPNNKIRIVRLTRDEINLLIEELERQPYNVYKFLNYKKIIRKLKEALKEPENE